MDSEKTNIQVLTEVPPSLQQLLLTLVKIFYGIECYIIFYYIQKKVILKEEELRQVCKIDQRQLRKFLVTLKVEKFIKERLVPQEGFNYFFYFKFVIQHLWTGFLIHISNCVESPRNFFKIFQFYWY